MDLAEIALSGGRERDAAARSAQANQALAPSYRLSSVIVEALRDISFAERWHDESDDAFRPLAVAVFDLRGVKRLSTDARAALVRELCRRRRRALLAEVLKCPIAPRVVRWLGRTDWTRFARGDWRLFFSIATRERETSSLGRVRVITRTLLRQFSFITSLLRIPALLDVASRLPVPADRWRRLDVWLEQADAGWRGELLHQAGTLATHGEFWDFYYRCARGHRAPFVIAEGFLHSESLHALASPLEMESEAKAMRNCLASRVGRVQNGSRVYFRHRAGAAVDAELRRTPWGWVPGEILGPQNAAVPSEIARSVQAELQRLARNVSVPGEQSAAMREDAYLEEVRRATQNAWAVKDLAKVRAALTEIQGQSLDWNRRAFVILQLRSGAYVQFAASPDGTEYICEIASYKYTPELSRYLTAETVEFLERAGFVWPEGSGNFLRWFPSTSGDDLRSMAELVLTVFARVFCRRKGGRIEVSSHLPSLDPPARC